MSHSNEAKPHARELARPNWSAVFAVAFCVACLITVEFLPVSLLTPMALDLGISEGMAGQSVTTTALWPCSPACLSPPSLANRSPLRGDPVFAAADPFLPAGIVCR